MESLLKTVADADIAREFQHVQSGPAALGMAGGIDAKAIFCRGWPAAKTVLGALSTIAPATVRLILGIILRAGDVAHETLCPNTGTPARPAA